MIIDFVTPLFAIIFFLNFLSADTEIIFTQLIPLMLYLWCINNNKTLISRKFSRNHFILVVIFFGPNVQAIPWYEIYDSDHVMLMFYLPKLGSILKGTATPVGQRNSLLKFSGTISPFLRPFVPSPLSFFSFLFCSFPIVRSKAMRNVV